jgi:hypothetical protein
LPVALPSLPRATLGDARPLGPLLSLARRAWLPLAAAFAILVHLPAMGAPFVFDDVAQVAMADGTFGAHRGPLDYYDYVDDANRASVLAGGDWPWWTQEQIVVRFLRPLASALRWADVRLFGHASAWHHAHSLLWWGVAVLGVRTLLRRSFAPRAALLGTFVFALAPCHAIPLVWLANREALLSAALGAWALVAYARWREEGRAADAASSAVLFGLALLAGEYSLGLGGYVVAIELAWRHGERERNRERRREGGMAGAVARRLLGVAPFVVPAAAYLAAFVAFGFDAHGAGFYRSPLHDFASFAAEAPRRLAILLGAAWLGVDESWTESSSWAVAVLGVGTVALLAVPLARVVRGLGGEERQRAAWMLLGSVLALGPVLAVEASSRLLGVAMIGVSALVGLLLDRAWFPPAPEGRRGAAELTGLVALVVGFAHLVRAPLDTALVERHLSHEATVYAARMDWVHAHVAPDTHDVYVLQASSPEALLWAPRMLGDGWAGGARPRWRVLTHGSGRSLLLRTGPRSIEIVGGARPLLPEGRDDLFRNVGALHVGDSVALSGMKATVVELDAQQKPHRLRFEFDADVGAPGTAWITEAEGGFREEELPPPGYGAPLLP